MMVEDDAWPEDTRREWNIGDEDDDMDEGPGGDGFAHGGRNRYQDAFGDYAGGYGSGGFRAPIGCGYGPRGPPGNPMGPRRGGFGGPPPYHGGFGGPPRRPGPDFWGGPRGPPGFPPPGGPPPPLMGPSFRGGPMRGGPMKGGPMGSGRISQESRAVKYLLRCGMAKENVRHLPRAVADLIEPQYCGVCSVELDSYAVSRIHYGSKNHLKNQRKWTQQPRGEAALGPREAPMKARELYCELCDVHITSKAHADSHYSGKAHRSVVEGRRAPKNPFLLQPGMNGRVEQLMRREKRHLPEAPEEPPAPAEPRPVAPELYCDICKTTVTNTEQMTMHMNGKKHLNKEKQHILRVMKGEVAPGNFSQDWANQSVPEEEVINDPDESIRLEEATVSFVVNVIESVFNKTAPVAVSRRKTPLKPWITPGMLACMRYRDQMHMKSKKNPEDKELTDNYKRYRNFINSVFKRLKNQYEKVRVEREAAGPEVELLMAGGAAESVHGAIGDMRNQLPITFGKVLPAANTSGNGQPGLDQTAATVGNGDDWQAGSVDW